MKKRIRKQGMLMIASASALALAALPVMAQQRVGSDGHALDANNRVGSNGYNSGPGENPNVTPNQIVYGNVTGGRAFTGTLQSTDPRAFRGPTAGNSMDRFVRDSAGAPAPFTQDNLAPQPQAYYGMSRGVAPPSGYKMEGFTGGYIQSNVTPGRTSGDARLGNPFVGVENITLPQPGDMVLAGPVSNQTDNTLITASPLYGIRQWQPGNPDDRNFLQNFTSLGEIKADLTEAGKEKTPATPPASATPQAGQNSQPLGAPLSNPPLQPLQSPSQNLAHQPLENTVASGQTYQTLSPAEQSPQYQQMHQRLEQFYKQQNVPDAQAKQMADQQMDLRQKANERNHPKESPAPTPAPANSAAPSGQAAPSDLGVPDYQKRAEDILKGTGDHAAPPVPHSASSLRSPVQVESLAEGVKSPGLANLLKRAEQLMKEGKFSSAIDTYKAANRLSPNNPLVLVGQANAELGGGYYTQAADHLRRAYLSDPTVAMAQFDLKNLIGSDRLTQVATDLKQIANKDLKAPAPVFLLSYVAYNTGSSELASQWLDEANRRADKKDPLFKLLKSHWSLSATKPATTESTK
jgi:tetratricopeptide (TPR) repeat protein